MDPITITLDADLIREALIALRDREHSLNREYRASPNTILSPIIRRQRDRVRDVIAALAQSVGEG